MRVGVHGGGLFGGFLLSVGAELVEGVLVSPGVGEKLKGELLLE